MFARFLRVASLVALASGLGGLSMASRGQTGNAYEHAAQQAASTVCASCHGPAGVSTSPVFPHLAGQSEVYLAAQLRAFKAKSRGEQDAHDYMWGMATLLDDSVIDGLAHYYSSQKPGPGIPGDRNLVERGKILFEQGDPQRQVPACSGCHGQAAEGNGIFPRLAGQHAAYVVRQLNAIQRRTRESPIMHGVIKELNSDGMKAVAEYLQSL
jgi:cytochrome c553